MRERDVGPARGVGRLLQEHGVPGNFEDVDGDREALAGEDGVHDRDVLLRQITRNGEDQDAGVDGRLLRGGVGGGWSWGCGGCGSDGLGDSGEVEGRFVDVS